jgi:hypothetical protein
MYDQPFIAFGVASVAQFKPVCPTVSHTPHAINFMESIARGFAMHAYRRTSILAIAVCLLGSAPSQAASGQSNVTEAPVDAIWYVQEFDFHFRTTQHYHSCASLHDKISGILEAVGAGSVVVKLSCSRDQLTNEAYARVSAAAPVSASPENIDAATTYDSRQTLLARVREVDLPTAEDIVRFPAEYRRVSLTRVPALRLGPGDCELLRRMNEQIFPHLSLRVVKKQLSCQAVFSPTRPLLVVEALMRREA